MIIDSPLCTVVDIVKSQCYNWQRVVKIPIQAADVNDPLFWPEKNVVPKNWADQHHNNGRAMLPPCHNPAQNQPSTSTAWYDLTFLLK